MIQDTSISFCNPVNFCLMYVNMVFLIIQIQNCSQSIETFITVATFLIYSNASWSLSNLSDINLNTPTLFGLSFISFKIRSFWSTYFGYVSHQQQVARSNNSSSSFVNENTEFIYIYLDTFLAIYFVTTICLSLFVFLFHPR